MIASVRHLLLITTTFLVSTFTMANITISGIYTGKNLRVSNPVCEDGMGLTVLKVRVNEEVVPFLIIDNEVVIDFRIAGIQVGTEIVITIESDPFTRPTVLNPTALESFRSFEDFKTGARSVINDGTTNEKQPIINHREDETTPKYR